MRKNIFLVALLCMFVPFTANAEQFIAGVGFGTGSGDVDREDGWYSLTDDIDTASFNLHLGFIDHRNNRFLFSYESISFDSDILAKEKANGFRFDTEFVYMKTMVKPYWGVGLGLYNRKDKLFDEDILGVSFQAKGGVKINPIQQLEIDLSLQVQGISWQDISYYYDTIETTTTHTSFNFGVAYLF